MLVSLPGACPSLPVWPFASLQISPAQNAELQSWSVLVSKFNRLQDLISRISLQPLKYSMGTGEGNLLWGLGVTASFP